MRVSVSVCEMRSSGCSACASISWLDGIGSPLKQLANLSTRSKRKLNTNSGSVGCLPRPLDILLHFKTNNASIECANFFFFFSFALFLPFFLSFSICIFFAICIYWQHYVINKRVLFLSSVIQIFRFGFVLFLFLLLLVHLLCSIWFQFRSRFLRSFCFFFSNYKSGFGLKSFSKLDKRPTNGSSLFTNRVFLIVIYTRFLSINRTDLSRYNW